MATADEDGLAQFCTMVGALALARATEGNPISDELLQAARTALHKSGSGTRQSERQQAGGPEADDAEALRS
jgi:TetR/AcrR family transcriptional repressor of nem operon